MSDTWPGVYAPINAAYKYAIDLLHSDTPDEDKLGNIVKYLELPSSLFKTAYPRENIRDIRLLNAFDDASLYHMFTVEVGSKLDLLSEYAGLADSCEVSSYADIFNQTASIIENSNNVSREYKIRISKGITELQSTYNEYQRILYSPQSIVRMLNHTATATHKLRFAAMISSFLAGSCACSGVERYLNAHPMQYKLNTPDVILCMKDIYDTFLALIDRKMLV